MRSSSSGSAMLAAAAGGIEERGLTGPTRPLARAPEDLVIRGVLDMRAGLRVAEPPSRCVSEDEIFAQQLATQPRKVTAETPVFDYRRTNRVDDKRRIGTAGLDQSARAIESRRFQLQRV